MLKRPKLLILTILLILHTALYSQYTYTGEATGGLKWQSIKTPHFELVFDTAYGVQAQRLAAILDYSLPLSGKTLKQPAKRIPVLVHNHNVISNGMVAWIPSRMELYTVPQPDLHSQGWLEMLAIHEGRHVAQMNRLNVFPTNVLSSIFGEIYMALPISSVHPWFLEGDAVVTETALTQSGRGRLPSFEMGIRTHLLSGKKPYHFRKAVHGSYHSYVPNHYELGYFMVAYNRAKYGPMLWENVLHDIGSTVPYVFDAHPFLTSVKSETRLNRKQMYNNTFEALGEIWRNQAARLDYTEFNNLNIRKNKSYTSYISPQYYKGEIFAIRKSIDDINRLVAVNSETGTERIIHTPGYILSERIRMAGPVIYFDEYCDDIRWPQRSYSNIKYINIVTGKKGNLTNKTRYFSPAPNTYGSQLAVIENAVNGSESIKIIDISTNEIVKHFAVGNNADMQHLAWDTDNTSLVMTRVDESGKSLVSLNTHTGEWQTLIQPAYYNISSPVCTSQYIYFNASYSGIDNIYAFCKETKQVFQVTSVQNGAFEPLLSANGGNMYFSNYTLAGYDISFSEIDTLKWVKLADIKKFETGLVQKIADQEPQKFDASKIEYKEYKTEAYKPLAHAINVHSWLPFYIYNNIEGPTEMRPMPGLTLMSQNLHNNFHIQAGSGFYKGRNYSDISLQYLGLYPQLAANIHFGDSINYINDNSKVAPGGRLIQFTGSASLPFNLSRGSTIAGIVPSAIFRFENRYYNTNNASVVKQNLSRTGLTAYAYVYRKRSQKQITPNLGISASASFLTPIRNAYFSDQYKFLFNMYLPGLLQHNSIKLTVAHEIQNPKYYFASSQLGPVRGWHDEWELQKPIIKDMTIYTTSYYMPLCYPDLRMLDVMYLKRLRSQLFVDYAIATVFEKERFYNPYSTRYFSSNGIELIADMRFFFIPQDISLGARLSYTSASSKIIAEFLFNVDLGNF